jgi:hypothetical protein
VDELWACFLDSRRLLYCFSEQLCMTFFSSLSWSCANACILFSPSVDQGRNDRDKALERMRDHLKAVYLEKKLKWIILFPEGGFLYKRREASQRWTSIFFRSFSSRRVYLELFCKSSIVATPPA